MFGCRYGEESDGISLKSYLDFFRFLNSINDVDTAVMIDCVYFDFCFVLFVAKRKT